MASSTMETVAGSGDGSFLLRFGAGHECQVVVGRDARLALARLWRADWRHAAIIGDATVLGLHGKELAALLSEQGVTPVLLGFPPGEKSKTRETKARLEDQLLTSGLDRQGCVVALGGGISLDVAGFIAATFMRGVAHVNVPTSLLAQVDACIGGKTGVNTPAGKNLVGAFHQPAAVLVDPRYLDTLPAPQWPNGLAELVKHAVIADADLLDWVEAHAGQLDGPPWSGHDQALLRAVKIKGDIVQHDEHELGLRRVLNYGHTVGHALEKASGHGVSHGQAVAIGMVVEGRAARTLCGLPADDLQRIEQILRRLGLPTSPAHGMTFDRLLPYLQTDKKRLDDTLHLALPTRIGQMAGGDGRHTLPVPVDTLRRAWDAEGAR